jgi:hypothetical protein
MLDATIQNLEATPAWRTGFVHPLLSIYMYILSIYKPQMVRSSNSRRHLTFCCYSVVMVIEVMNRSRR